MNILIVRFRTNREFGEHYQEDLSQGGLFCPTTTEYTPDEEVILELSIPALPNKLMIRGTVRSWRASLPRLRVRAGAIVEFNAGEKDKKDFILKTVASNGVDAGIKRRHSRLPIDVQVRFRLEDQSDYQTSSLSEVSAGGAMLRTKTPLPLDSSVIIELTPPGAVGPFWITAKVTYHLPSGDTGLKFLYRDAGGSKRLRELVRRLREGA